jgi:hypothetical protein
MQMASVKKPDKSLQFTQLYRMPGEGLIAEFIEKDQTRLYDIEGLRYRVLKRRAAGLDTSEEDKALAIMSSID